MRFHRFGRWRSYGFRRCGGYWLGRGLLRRGLHQFGNRHGHRPLNGRGRSGAMRFHRFGRRWSYGFRWCWLGRGLLRRGLHQFGNRHGHRPLDSRRRSGAMRFHRFGRWRSYGFRRRGGCWLGRGLLRRGLHQFGNRHGHRPLDSRRRSGAMRFHRFGRWRSYGFRRCGGYWLGRGLLRRGLHQFGNGHGHCPLHWGRSWH